jgi:membrane-associated phospholipid phosphatase
MKLWQPSVAATLATFALTAPASAESPTEVHPLSRIGSNTVDSFTGTNAILHAGGVASTMIPIGTDVDYEVHRYFAGHPEYDPCTVPAVYGGYAVPVLLGGGLYLTGVASDELTTTAAGSAVLQASLLAVSYSSLLKAVTGRPHPDPERQPDMRAASREFRFGFLRGGVHYGWPSGHLATNTAAMVSLFYLFPDKLWMQLAGSTYLADLAAGVSSHDGGTMHWFSDVVAGSLMGVAIGSAVGRGYRAALGKTRDQSTAWTVSPMLELGRLGVSVSVQL